MHKLSTEFICTALFLIFGAALVFITPPLQVPDELPHIFRAYQVSEGILRGPYQEYLHNEEKVLLIYADVPQSLWRINYPDIGAMKNYHSLNSIAEVLKMPLNAEEVIGSAISNTGSYSPLVYAPQALGAFFGRTIFGTVGAVIYLARLGALIFTAICLFLSMKILPQKKLLIVALAFMPMFLFETASCSSDPVIYSISILSTAYLLSLAESKTPITAREIFFIAAAAIALGLSKQIYGTILIAYFFIPAERFGGKTKFYSFGAFLLILYLIAAFGWIQFAKWGVEISPALSPESDMAAQLNFIKESPLQFLKIIFNTFVLQGKYYFEQFIGQLGWLAIPFSQRFYYFYFAVILVCASIGNLNLKISHRLLMLFSIVPTIFAMMFYMYITWTPLQHSDIWGVQGRYFIPSAFIFFAAFSHFKNFHYEKIFACLIGLTGAIMTLYKVFNHFY